MTLICSPLARNKDRKRISHVRISGMKEGQKGKEDFLVNSQTSIHYLFPLQIRQTETRDKTWLNIEEDFFKPASFNFAHSFIQYFNSSF